MYVQSATLNGKTLNSIYFPASELLKGGSAGIEDGISSPGKWGIAL